MMTPFVPRTSPAAQLGLPIRRPGGMAKMWCPRAMSLSRVLWKGAAPTSVRHSCGTFSGASSSSTIAPERPQCRKTP